MRIVRFCLALTLIPLALGEGLPVPGFPVAAEVPGSPNRLLVTPDGKIIVSGGGVEIPGRGGRRIVRLNRDGSLDPSFDPKGGGGSGFGTGVPFVRQDDGLLIVSQQAPAGTGGQAKVMRLGEDGAADPSWRSRYPYLDGAVNQLALWGNLGVYAAGDFQNVVTASGFPQPKKERRSKVARFKSDGSLDNVFVPQVMTAGSIYAMEVQPDGRILVAGELWLPETSQYSFILRYDSDGSFDPEFKIPLGVLETCLSLRLQPDGGILYVLLSKPTPTLAQFGRLTANGEIDAAFAPRIEGAEFPVVSSVAVQGDQKILIAGNFRSINGVPRNGIARLFPDGRLDPDFDPGAGPNGGVSSLSLDWNGDVLVGGSFTEMNGRIVPGLARLECEDRVPPPKLGIRYLELPVVLFSSLSPLKIYRMESASSVAANDWTLFSEFYGDPRMQGFAVSEFQDSSRIFRILVR